jgi:hypothetical protein
MDHIVCKLFSYERCLKADLGHDECEENKNEGDKDIFVNS